MDFVSIVWLAMMLWISPIYMLPLEIATASDSLHANFRRSLGGLPAALRAASDKSTEYANFRGQKPPVYPDEYLIRDHILAQWPGPEPAPKGDYLEGIVKVLRLPYIREQFVPIGWDCTPLPSQGNCRSYSIAEFAEIYKKSPTYGKEGSEEDTLAFFDVIECVFREVRGWGKFDSKFFEERLIHDIIKKYEALLHYGVG